MISNKTNQRKLLVKEMLTKQRLTTAKATAIKLNCSTRTIERILKELRTEGLNFKYNKTLNRYIMIKNIHNGHYDDKGDAENLIE